MAPSLAHDYIVLTRSLAAAITKASSRQRDRALTMRAAAAPARRRHRPIASHPPPERQQPLITLETAPIREAAAAQQQGAIDTRARAQTMLAANAEMRTRLQKFNRRITKFAALHDRNGR